jgi:2-C-methyl-D-erythritol 4-phosphate cytidylyltransferase
MLTAIIVAGGSSRRMGFDKTFASLGGKPVIAHTISAFQAAECVDGIILVGRRERLPELDEVSREYAFTKVQAGVAGGEHRQDSVRAGLDALDQDCRYVAVHDAARPLVNPAQIDRVFAAARTHEAAALAAPVTDTLKRATADHVVSGSIEREGVYAMQTPQIFSRALLLRAFSLVAEQKLSVTDEVSAIQALGHAVVLVPNDDLNFKITFPADLAVAEFVLSLRAR